MASDHTYTVRFGIGMAMRCFLGEDLDIGYARKIAAMRSDEYYINMMRAWYMATALAKNHDLILPFLQEHRMDSWTHNKTIQKARESYRITPVQKAYLKSLKITSS